MATINITTTYEEREQVLDALANLKGETVSVSQIASATTLSSSRVRYVLMDLEDLERIRKVPTKMINARYIRYTYEVLV